MRKAFLLIVLLLAVLFSGCGGSTVPVEPFNSFVTEGVTISLYPIRAVVDGTYRYEMVKEGTVISSGTVLVDGSSYTFTSVKGKQFTATVDNDKMTFSSNVPLDDGTNLVVTASEPPVSNGEGITKTPTAGSDGTVVNVDGTVVNVGDNQTPTPSGFDNANPDFIHYKATTDTKYMYCRKYPTKAWLLAFSESGKRDDYPGASSGWLGYTSDPVYVMPPAYTSPMITWSPQYMSKDAPHIYITLGPDEQYTDVTLTQPDKINGMFSEFVVAQYPLASIDDGPITVNFTYVNKLMPIDGLFAALDEVEAIVIGAKPDMYDLLPTAVKWSATYKQTVYK